VKGSWDSIAAVQVVSNATFTLTEIALQAERCFEYATVDMKHVHHVGMIRCAHRKRSVGQLMEMRMYTGGEASPEVKA
jgi:hypothetical protein